MTVQCVSPLVIRADADSVRGFGHVYRGLAIAEMLAAGGEAMFFTRTTAPSVTRAIAERAKLVMIDGQESLGDEAEHLAAQLSGEETVVLDGRRFDASYQMRLKSRGCRVVCIDDRCEGWFAADLVVNHAGAARRDAYRCESKTQLCLGPRFAVLRPLFLAAARTRRRRAANAEVLISLGGADPNNDLLAALAMASGKLPEHHFHIVVGPGYRFAQELGRLLKDATFDWTLHDTLFSDQMAALMSRCATAVTTPSTVSYEYSSVGGLLYLHQTAQDQALIHRGLIESGMAFDLEGPTPDRSSVEEALERQRVVFDGRSDERLRHAIGALVAS